MIMEEGIIANTMSYIKKNAIVATNVNYWSGKFSSFMYIYIYIYIYRIFIPNRFIFIARYSKFTIYGNSYYRINLHTFIINGARLH